MTESNSQLNNVHKLSPEHQILEAAIAVIAENKISGTRMRHIAERAQMSQGTIHYYFPTKADLLLAMLDEMQASFDQDRRERLAEGDIEPAEKIRLFLVQQNRILTEYPSLLEVFYDFWGQGIIDPRVRPKVQWMYEEWRNDMMEAVAEGVEKGDFVPRHAHLAPALLVSLLEGGALQYLIEHGVFDLEQYFDAAYDEILGMLGFHKVREPYPTDLSDMQWASIGPHLPAAKPGGRPASVSLRDVVNAIVYMRHVQCSWRMLPHDLPHWQTVYGYYRRWSKDGTLAKIESLLNLDLQNAGSLTKEESHD
jgi:TetR/AcrR family transcriptional regulator